MQSPPASPAASRKYDAVILLCQQDEQRKVLIEAVNAEAAALLGYGADELIGIPLRYIVTPKVAQAIDDYVDYEEGSADLDDVLKRVRQLKLLTKQGEEITPSFKVVRTDSPDKHQRFRLLITDEKTEREGSSLRSMIALNLEGHRVRDSQTGLANRYSAEAFLPIIAGYVKSHDLQACLVVLRIDRHEKNLARYGEEQCAALLKHVASFCERSLRSDDVICQLSNHTLLLVLLDIAAEPARVVLNRLRWFVASHRIPFGGKANFSVTISLVFHPVNTVDDAGEMLRRCESMAARLPADERNALIELSASE